MVSASYRVGSLMRAALYSLAVACLCGAASASESEAVAGVTLDEIKQRLTEWRGSFVNVRVVWEVRILPQTEEAVEEWPPPPDPESAPCFARWKWIWADHGLDLTESWRGFYEDGSSKGHTIEVFNAPKGFSFRAHFQKPTREEPEKYQDVEIFGLGVGKPISSIEQEATESLYWPGFAAWLPEILSKWKWELEEVEDVGGRPCARIAAIRDEGTRWEIFEVLWLDLDHDCLVRRHRRRTLSGIWGKGRDFIVDDFQQLDAGIWFPKRCRMQVPNPGMPYDNHLIVVTEAAVNERIDLSGFDPPAPGPGTAVADHIGYYRRTAGESASAVGSTVVDQADQSSRPSAVPPMQSWVWWSSGLAGFSVLFLLAGLWLSRQKKGG
jgi:hypothetical protein